MKPASFTRIEPEEEITEPVTLAEAKAQLRMGDDSSEDDYITSLITAAREWAEEYTRRAIVTQSWRVAFSDWPGCHTDRQLMLARPPVSSLTSLQYYPAGSDELTALDADLYKTDLDELPGVIQLAPDAVLPSLNYNYANPIRAVFVCGYETVPTRVKVAILQVIAHLFENRVPYVAGTIVSEVPLSAKALLDGIRLRNI